MPSLLVDRVSFSYQPGQRVLSDLRLHLDPGWVGVVGANGSGKTTLLRLLDGSLRPTAGTLRSQPNALLVHRCAQQVSRLSPEIEALAWDWSGAGQRLRGELGLRTEQLERWDSLSPGERKRWQIGAALAAKPDLLLLDEPSNHLDAPARTLLIAALARFRGVGLVVSHDRALLDALTDRTLRVAKGRVTSWPGGYGEARQSWLADEAHQQQRFEAADRKARALRRRLGDARRAQAGAAARLSSRHRMKGPRDSEARSSAAKGRARHGEASVARRVTLSRAAERRAAAGAQALRPGRALGGQLQLQASDTRRSVLLSLSMQALRAGDRVLIRDLDLRIAPGQRVWLRGENGSGKSTLLRALAEAGPLSAEQLLHLPQVLTAARVRMRLRQLHGLGRAERGALLQRVAALGLSPTELLGARHPSPGEARKLELAVAMARGVPLLLLDEPTNHLDLPTVERLEKALGDWPGGLLLVSHDERFARACTDQRWTIDAERLRIG